MNRHEGRSLALMLSWIVLFVTLAAAVVLGTLIFGNAFGRGEDLQPPDSSTTVSEANAAAIRNGDFSALRFSVTTRGYSPRQVDAALEELFARLQEKEADHPPQWASVSPKEREKPTS